MLTAYQPRSTKPVTIPHTSRQKLKTRSGVELERQFIYAPAETWAALGNPPIFDARQK